MARTVSILALALLAVACDQQAPDTDMAKPNPSPVAVAESPAPLATPPDIPVRESTGARSVKEETGDFLFEYAYPATAGNIDELGDLLDERLEKVRTELASSSAQARRQAREDGFPYNKHSYQGKWSVVTDMPAWLSLTHEFSTYSGGAHGHYGVQALVWDKTAGRAFEPIELFTSPAALEEALGDRFCKGLEKARKAKGIEQPIDGVFPACPDIKELVVIVGSSDNRNFNRMTLYAGPYVAGAYAEGDYEVNLNVDRAIIAAVKPEYRASFRTRN